MGKLQTLAKALIDDGLVLPTPVVSFLEGKAQPLALGTRERLPDWCVAHGYGDEQRRHLNKLIGAVVRRERYLRAVASGSSRIDLDGAESGPVSEADRENAAQKLAAGVTKRTKPAPATPPGINFLPKSTSLPPEPAVQPPEPGPLPEPPPVASDAIQALASAVDAAITRPARKGVTRAPVVEVRKRRSLKEFDGKGRNQYSEGSGGAPTAQREAADTGIIQPMPPPLPASVVSQAVDRANTRRNSLRLIAVHLKAGNNAAIAAERSAWVAEASDALAAAGNDRARAKKQVVIMVDVMLTGIAPRSAWS